MEELKHKFLGFINKQAPKIPSMGFSDSNYHFSQVETLSINSKTVGEAYRPADQDILESIEAAYFSTDELFDICRFELGKLTEAVDCDQIQRDFTNLKQQHQVVSKKVLQLILEHQSSCNKEFHHVLEILDKVSDTLELCRASRRNLNITKKEFSSCLGVLANYRKRKLAENLLNDLKTIKELYNFENRLNRFLNDGDYVGAILELRKCQKMASNYRHFTCVKALTYKLQETFENTDSQLDRVLAQTCFHFNGDHYSKLQSAYNLLDKSQISMIDNLHVHYITAIYNSSLNVVSSYVSTPDNLESNDTSGKNPYKTLCQTISQNVFIPCLVHLCKVLFKIVLSYHQLTKWYNVRLETQADIDNQGVNIEGKLEKQKLDHYLLKIWDDVQRKVSSLLLNAEFAGYKFDQFVQVLSVVHRLIQVGDEFCSSKSHDLQESIRQQSVNYFKSYHAQRLEELKIFLENEVWEICPVKPNFNILQLQEFKSLRSILKSYKMKTHPQTSPTVLMFSTGSNECGSSTHSQDGSSTIGRSYFVRYASHGTPFDSGLDETLIEEDILANEYDYSGYFTDDSDEESEDLKKDFVDEYADEPVKNPVKTRKEKHNNKTPILTNTTLSVLRQMGKYLQMSRLLKPIAYQIITCMDQLFDYYLFAVHTFFASDLTVSSATLYSSELNATLKKISSFEFCPQENGDHVSEGKFIRPSLSPIVDLTKPEQLHGLAERIVAVESLIFLSEQYHFLQGYLEHLISPTNRIILQQFFTQNIGSALYLRKPIYMAVTAQAFDLRQILILMSKINWKVKDVMSQHNGYIDMLLREVQIFTLRLEDVTSKVPISNPVSKALWENIAHIVTHTIVQGFSEAKKCSNGGRALMQLDFTQFLSKFEKISSLRPVPHKEYVENYVKAYYLPEHELEKWIKEHSEYSTKHLFGLISCMCQNNRKTKQRLLQVVEDLEKNQTVTR